MVDRATIEKRLAQVDAANRRLTAAKMTTSSNTTGEPSTIAEYKAETPVFVDTRRNPEVLIVAYESFTTDGTTGNTETFTLSHDLVDSPVFPSGAAGDDLVLYEGNTAQQPDALDYGADSFDYTDDGSNNTLHAYYVARAAGLVRLRKTAPGGSPFQDLMELNTGRLPVRNQDDEPLQFDLEDVFDAVVPPKWKLQVVADLPFSTQFEDDQDSDATAVNMLVNIPIREADRRVDGLDQFVRTHASTR